MLDDVPKVVYVVKVENSGPATHTMGMADNVSCSDPKVENAVESAPANLEAVDNGTYWKNSLIMHPHCSKFQVARDFTEAHSVI